MSSTPSLLIIQTDSAFVGYVGKHFKDIIWVIRNSKDRQNRKGTNEQIIKLRLCNTNPTKTGYEFRCSESVGSTSSSRRVTLVVNNMMSN